MIVKASKSGYSSLKINDMSAVDPRNHSINMRQIYDPRVFMPEIYEVAFQVATNLEQAWSL